MDTIIFFFSKLLKVKTTTLNFYIDFKSGVVKYLLLDSPIKIITMVGSFVTPIMAQKQFDLLTSEHFGEDALVKFGSLVAILAVYQLFLTIFSTIIDWKTRSQKIQISNYYIDKYIAQLEELDMGKFHSNTKSLIEDVRASVGNGYKDIIQLASLIVSIPATLIGFILVAKYINSTMILLIFVNSLVSFCLNVYKLEVYKKGYLLNFEKLMMFSRIRSRFFYDFSELILNGKIDQVKDLYTNTRLENDKINVSQHIEYAKIGLIDTTLNAITTSGLAIFAGFLVYSGSMTIGAYTTYPQYNQKMVALVNAFSVIFTKLQELKLSLIKLEFVLDLESTVDFSGQTKISSIDEIQFDEVFYQYENLSKLNNILIEKLKEMNTPTSLVENKYVGWLVKLFCSDTYLTEEIDQLKSDFESEQESKVILNRMSFSLKKGEFVSVIGSNGCGKTTAWSMLMKGLSPTKGRILLNGISIDEYEPFALKREIILITQKQRLLKGFTIKELLNFENDPGITLHHMKEVTTYLGLEFSDLDFSKKIGDEIELSGGQEQLVLMSSVFLNKFKVKNKASVIILDEGTNQMDPDKKTKVIQGIKTYLDDTITILVSHEMELCMSTDRVLIFQDGKVSEQGTPEHLLTYDNLFSQFKGKGSSKKTKMPKNLQLVAV